eukprot:147230-Rhodomonas_salina.1
MRFEADWQVRGSLRAFCAISGTDLPCGASCLRACYMIPGTEKESGTICVRTRSAIRGTTVTAPP